MKTLKVAVLVAAISLSQNVFAQEGEASFCVLTEKFAEAYMEGRQAGLKLSAAMQEVNSGTPAGKARDIMHDIIKEAYAIPRYESYLGDEFQKHVVNDFADRMYLKCLNSDLANR